MDRYNVNIKFMKVDMESKHNSTRDSIEGILDEQLSSLGGISNSQLISNTETFSQTMK